MKTEAAAQPQGGVKFGRRSPRVGGHFCAPIYTSHGAVFVKSTGDGILAVLPGPSDAIALAETIHTAAAKRALPIRFGVSQGPIRFSRHDVFGTVTATAKRLCDLVSAGQIAVDEVVRRSLTPEQEATLSDLGECHMRNVATPLRVHALTIGAPPPHLPLLIPETALRVRVAVLPFLPREGAASDAILGMALADEIISVLSTARELSVISPLSTRRQPRHAGTVDWAADALNAGYVLSGRYSRGGALLVVDATLTDTDTGEVMWSGRQQCPVADAFNGERGLSSTFAAEAARAIIRAETRRARVEAIPTQENYTLLIAGVSMLHSLWRQDFEAAKERLEALAHRASHNPVPLAWLAKWHVMNTVQGWSADPSRDAAAASVLAERALEADPDCALAHCMRGLVETVLRCRPDIGVHAYLDAQAANASEPLGWLLHGALLSFTDDGDGALSRAAEALALSPIDPQRYLFHAIAAGAALTAGRHADALAYAESSLRANGRHISTLRVKAVAQWRLGQEEAARETVARLRSLSPGATVGAYRAASPNADFRIGQEIAAVLAAAGLPE